MQFVDGHFVESYYPTIENTFSKVIRYKGQDYATEIIDTAGQVSLHLFHSFLNQPKGGGFTCSRLAGIHVLFRTD